ncbi:hypothetical protein AVW16_13830 [Crenobacter luteus]|uniref:Uncharacterized protein n=1 Tax=Crenobacter luteus TaxID=1452487 RepID=A0A161SC12_9NEIS|nr:hypothetical protein AVW16_13830 [Crenobacter luteus]
MYPEIVTLADELGQCLATGVAVWRDSYWDEARAYRDSPDSLADMSDAEFDRCTLAGYPEGIQSAAHAIFCGLHSAEQHGGFKSFAAAIRWHCSISDDIPDRHLYALAAAIEAWWAIDSLVTWLNEGMDELARVFSPLRDIGDDDLLAWMDADPGRWAALEHQNYQNSVDEWAIRYPKQFTRWAIRQREKQAFWALSEAEKREQAARHLGEAERLLILADLADELSQAALDRASLKDARHKIAQRDAVQRRNASKATEGRRKYDEAMKAGWVSTALTKLARNTKLSVLAVAQQIVKESDLPQEAVESVREGVQNFV